MAYGGGSSRDHNPAVWGPNETYTEPASFAASISGARYQLCVYSGRVSIFVHTLRINPPDIIVLFEWPQRVYTR